jgi:uncharacterized damage-inducible protein DinB
MTKETLNKHELFVAIDNVMSQVMELFASLDESEINSVPFKDSWTAGQLMRHITKSTNGMANALGTKYALAARSSDERVPELKKIFLDSSKKFESPEFVVPENETYDKEATIRELEASVRELKENAEKSNLDELTDKLPLGPITKLEILHFVVYHTTRHLDQLEKICDALKAKV